MERYGAGNQSGDYAGVARALGATAFRRNACAEAHAAAASADRDFGAKRSRDAPLRQSRQRVVTLHVHAGAPVGQP